MDKNLRIAFIGGGNMAWALGAGMADKICPAANFHVVDPSTAVHTHWVAHKASVATHPDAQLAHCNIWIYAVKPQFMRAAVTASRAWLRPNTLVMSVAAGIRGDILAGWLASAEIPDVKLVRGMPNTPALVGQGVTGVLALPSVSSKERALVDRMLGTVGKVIWVANDEAIDAVAALSGSGPAYVFRFIEALIAGGQQVGLDPKQAHELALATLTGAVYLANTSSDSPQVLRERVTSKKGITEAALQVLDDAHFVEIVARAMAAAQQRSRDIAQEFGQKLFSE